MPWPQLAALCQKYGIAELSVFGSVARGDDRPDSDVDFLYVRGADSVLGMAFFGMQEELEELLGRKVDLVRTTFIGSSRTACSPMPGPSMLRDDLYLLEMVEAADRIGSWLTDVAVDVGCCGSRGRVPGRGPYLRAARLTERYGDELLTVLDLPTPSRG